MSSISSFAASYLVNSMWEVVLVAGTGWLGSRLLKRLGPQAEHIAWVSTLILAVLTPAIPLLRSLLALLFVPQGTGADHSILLVAGQGGGPKLEGVHVLPAAFVLALLVFYVASLVYFAARFAWSLHCTSTLLRQARPLSLSAQQDAIWRQCQRSYSLNTTRILTSSRIPGPVTLGFRNPALILPVELAAGCTSEDLLAALAHECAHIKRRDFQKNLFYEAASLLVSFHPVMWMIKSGIAQTREMVCDGMVTDRLVNSRSYARSLLRLASKVAVTSQASPSHAIGIFDANILEKRIMIMKYKKQHVAFGLKFGLIIPASLMLLSASVAGTAAAVVIEPQSQSETADKASPAGPVYKVGKDVSAPVPIQTPPAEFPKSGRNLKPPFEALVVVSLIVDSSGMPLSVHVVHSYKPDFDAEAIKAVRQYRFTPAKRSGTPVAVRLSIEVNFKKF